MTDKDEKERQEAISALLTRHRDALAALRWLVHATEPIVRGKFDPDFDRAFEEADRVLRRLSPAQQSPSGFRDAVTMSENVKIAAMEDVCRRVATELDHVMNVTETEALKEAFGRADAAAHVERTIRDLRDAVERPGAYLERRKA